MQFEVVRARKDGVLVPRWQLSQQPVYSGFLRVEEIRIPSLARTSIVARIIPELGTGIAPPDLYDMRLLSSNSSYLTLTGFEIGETMGGREAHYMQSWFLTPTPKPVLTQYQPSTNMAAFGVPQPPEKS